ncbi:snurportin-1-like [Centruroides sculpturatus]|uniref:snurportin-1-like n=1 Tax=Centruroides sculpturatus TaxID=218467 RepID=UPI000C6CB4FF|nr:snurportin-1-like [Centruroides sculpturatus]
MEELVNLASEVQLSSAYDVSNRHPRFSQYKVKKKMTSQIERRQKFLESIKQHRYDYMNHARKLAENTWSSESEDDDEMDWSSEVKKPSHSYKNQLMLSEWLVEVPEDLLNKWLLVLCPVGKRSLIITSHGETKVYTKKGFLLNKFSSHLPGGNRRQKFNSSEYTILDCIYNIENKTYYILDVMCWRGHPVFDSETEFRFYWLKCKTDEVPEIQVKSNLNPFRFIPLLSYSCSYDSIHKVVNSPLPFECQLDGLLFYHKQTIYTGGVTPLVGWLKAYMLPEILNISVPEHLCADRPKSYSSMRNHLSVAFAKHEKRKEEEKLLTEIEEDMVT